VTETEPLLTAFDVGLILRRSARTVHRMVERGDLQVAQKLPGPNGAYLFRKQDVEKLVPVPQDAA